MKALTSFGLLLTPVFYVVIMISGELELLLGKPALLQTGGLVGRFHPCAVL